MKERTEVAIDPPGTREAAACRRAARADFGTRLTLAANAARNVQLQANAETRQANGATTLCRTDPALAKTFAKAWAGLWVTTGPSQHFYRKEFALAHARDARLAQNQRQVEAMLAPTQGEIASASETGHVERLCDDVSAWLDTLAATGQRGWGFRAARDILSLVGNLSLLGVIAAGVYREREVDVGIHPDPHLDLHTGVPTDIPTGMDGWASAGVVRGMTAANTPFGVPWADWSLLAFEGVKGVLTQSLGSPTLIRHHAVDEILKRMDAGCRLLEACVLLPSAGTASAAPASSWRNTLARLTRARDVATLFTFANSAVPPARLGLWVPSWFSGASETADGYRGVLRVAGLMLDSCRAVTSLLGTWARNEAFACDAARLTQRWHALCERLAHVSCEDKGAIQGRVARVTQLVQHCDTPLLAKIASQPTLCECLLASRRPLSASQIALACGEFDVPCHASSVDGLNYLSLHPAESPWGLRWTGDAWEGGSTTPVRASYRLLLLYQHWSAALLERAVGALPCMAAQDDAEQREGKTQKQPRTTASVPIGRVMPVGLADGRAERRDTPSIEVESTWI
ncbi:hypothetical protein UC34_07510 [Pandoraea vervacti]|uniref:Uncharacterized protein n=1 Tax=Pandoraea vervacti TaxID=656178 RepID=A0ABN4G179_9BURK|nr:hypothetical protein [Pandoraea vervacti]AJP56881.1 hypothetical protein UC34_07510 [Pandoraea vervacti]